MIEEKPPMLDPFGLTLLITAWAALVALASSVALAAALLLMGPRNGLQRPLSLSSRKDPN